MKSRALGCFVVRARRQLGLTQRQLSLLLDVRQCDLSRWESGVRPVPAHHVPALAEALGCSPAQLASLTQRPTLLSNKLARWLKPRLHYARRSSVTATFDDVASLGSEGTVLVEVVRQLLSSAELIELETMVPRDSIAELALHCGWVRGGCSLTWLRLADVACPMLTLEYGTTRDLPRSIAGDLVPCFVYESRAAMLALFPQVSIGAFRASEIYRLDYLVLLRVRGRPDLWFNVELDGRFHHRQQFSDQRRHLNLGIPQIRLGFDDIFRPDLVEHVLKRAWPFLEKKLRGRPRRPS